MSRGSDYLSNRLQVSMVYRLINHADVGRALEEFVNHESQASVLPTCQVVYHASKP